MKILVAVMGAELHAVNGIHQASRDTWAGDVSQFGDLRFFIGNGPSDDGIARDINLRDDEIRVSCPDDKAHLLYKTVELLRWSVSNGYDLILKITTDTYVNVDEILKNIPSGMDYVGSPVGAIGELYANTNCYSFIQGSATWLSARAALLVVDEVLPTMNRLLPETFRYNGVICPYPHSEDLWIGQVLTPHIKSGAFRSLSDPKYSDGPITFHYGALPPERRTGDACMFSWFHRLHESRHSIERMMAVQRGL